MRVIFSRKGFDSAAGKAPSPVINGVPISLPIPTKNALKRAIASPASVKSWSKLPKDALAPTILCHEDPVFSNGRWVLVQTGAAQSHLEKNGVNVGDVFLFFGLFATPEGRDRHHRIFGYLEVDEVRRLGERPGKKDDPAGFLRRHPHTIGQWNENNTLYLGSGAKAQKIHPHLRLTKPGASPSVWHVPSWLKLAGLTYHSKLSSLGRCP